MRSQEGHCAALGVRSRDLSPASVTMDAFAQRKASTLAELALDAGDLSRAGHVDARARAVVALVNTHPAFYTTSSCAGRVSLFADPTSETRAAGMKGGEWVYVNHDPADAAAIVSAVRRKLGEEKDAASSSVPDPECSLVLRFEPFILSVEADGVEAGGRFAKMARDAGFRESGVVVGERRVVCSVRCSIRMEAPLVSKGQRLVSDEAIETLVAIANEKWAANAARAERLRERIAETFAAESAGRDAGDRQRTETNGAASSSSRLGGGLKSSSSSKDSDKDSDSDARVFAVETAHAKRCKDALKSAGWLDKTRRAGGDARQDGTRRVLLPVTRRGAEALEELVAAASRRFPMRANDSAASLDVSEDAESTDSEVNAEGAEADAASPGSRLPGETRRTGASGPVSEPVTLEANPAVSAILQGVASVFATDSEPGSTPPLASRPEKRSPAALVRAAALIVAPEAESRARPNEIPNKWEKLGDLALLPSESFRSETLWPRETRARLYRETAAALGVTRLARQAEVSQGPKRESRAELLWDPERVGGWTETKELGVWYGLDVTKVMFSSGNGTEKRRMGAMAAAGETVVDLFAGIGYYTLQMLRHAGVAKVIACEWNPHSVEALRRNLERNGFGFDRCEVREGDNRRVAPAGVADRVLLGLLPDSERAWPTAVAALRDSGGVLHVHGNVAAGEESVWARRLEEEIATRAAELGREWSVRVEHVERVKWYAPRVRHLVADVRCVPARLTSAWAHAVGASTSTSSSPATTPRESGSSSFVATSSYVAPRPGFVRTRVQSLESPDPSLAGATPTRLSRNARRGAFAGKVRRMHRPTRAGFADGPALAREPCVLTGLDLGPAPWTWSPEHLASKPGVASAEVSVHVSASPHLDFVRKNFAFENLAFGEFLNRLRDEGTGTGTGTGPADAKTNENENASRSWYYLRSIGSNPRKEPAHALAQFPELAEELRVPGDVLWGASVPAARLAEDARYFSAVLRCSSGGTRLWTHYDAMDNALIQLHGEKRVLLFPPRVSAGLYLEGSSSPVVGPEVDGDASLRAGTENGDEKKTSRPNAFPAYRAARRAALEVFLQPGDVLFIPALWAHHTEAMHGPSVAVNVFWRELPKTAYPQKDLYGNADPLAAGEALRLVDAAAKSLANSPRDHKVFYGGLAASRLLRDLRVERDVASTFAAFDAESDVLTSGNGDFPSTAAEGVHTGRRHRGDGAETSPTALGVWFAPPARWADAAKGAALGIGAFVAWRRLYGSSGGS